VSVVWAWIWVGRCCLLASESEQVGVDLLSSFAECIAWSSLLAECSLFAAYRCTIHHLPKIQYLSRSYNIERMRSNNRTPYDPISSPLHIIHIHTSPSDHHPLSVTPSSRLLLQIHIPIPSIFLPSQSSPKPNQTQTPSYSSCTSPRDPCTPLAGRSKWKTACTRRERLSPLCRRSRAWVLLWRCLRLGLRVCWRTRGC
jgi:hypothetical protein